MVRTNQSVFVTMGSSNHTKSVSEKDDFYATDPSAITLLDKGKLLDKDEKYWECACGNGALSKELIRLGYDVSKNTDLIDRGFGTAGIDFLKCTEPFEGNIITNPPFKLLNEFILKGLELSSNKLYIFSRLQTLETIKRWEQVFKYYKPIWVCPFVRRVQCYAISNNPKRSAVAYAWFIWDVKQENNETRVKWLI